MPRHSVFELQNSDLNAFLFAEIGAEPNGMQLTVVSVIARRGEDPWTEARRLAILPKASAADYLARIIAQMPRSPWSLAEAAVIAARLILLLPTGAGGSPPSQPLPHLRKLAVDNRAVTIVLSIAFLAYLAFSAHLQNSGAAERARSDLKASHESAAPSANPNVAAPPPQMQQPLGR